MAKIKRPQESSLMEVLEPRLLLSATPDQIVQALDLPGSPSDVSLNYTGDPVAVQSRTLHMTGGLLGFPTGLDEDFLMLSTGQAAWIDTVHNTGSSQGTDLGAEGVDGDTASISFTLSVPASDRKQKLKLDFMFLTEELAEWRSSTFLDSFTVSVNGANVVDMAIDDDLIVSDGTLPATGTFFDGRTPKLTAVYVIPTLTYSLDVVVTIADVGDGKYDSAALLDNVRFETSEYVYLNFEGTDVGDHFGWGTQTVLPAFNTEDIRVYEDRATVIGDILADVDSKFDDYDIEFGLTPPAEGDYTTIVIGGSGDTWTHLDPILQVLKYLPSNVTLNDFGANLLGLADAIDANNVEKNSLGVVLAKEFELYGPSAMDDLATVIAHELGHTLGLRHVTDAGDLMQPGGVEPDPAWTFGDTDMPLAEQWTDGQTTQNDNTYLMDVLGGREYLTATPGTLTFTTTNWNTPQPVTVSAATDADTTNGTATFTVSATGMSAQYVVVTEQDLGGLIVSTANLSVLEAGNAPFTVQLASQPSENVTVTIAKQSGDVSSHAPDTGTFLKTFNISYAGTLYDVTIGTSHGQVHLNTLSGTEHITLPVLSPDATIFLYAASKRNGPINIVSGTPTAAPGALVDPLKPVVGLLDYGDSQIPLYNGVNLISEIPLSQLRSDGQFKQLAKVSRGALVNTSVQISTSDYYAADEIDWLDKNSGTFTDADGDVYTVRLTGGGTASVILDDLDGDGKGSISQVLLENTTARSALTIKVKTPRGGAGDGKVEIGEIIAPELGQISATSSDLVGKGIQITDLLGALKINDIADDSAVWAGGNRTQRSTLQAHVIGDGVEISLGSEIRSFKAASVGQATIEAPGIGTMTIMGDRAMGLPGDFAANVTLGTTLGLATTLSSVRILGDMSGSDWDIASGQAGTFSVIGTVSDSLIRTGGSLRSFSAGEMTSSNLYVGIHKSFTALGGSAGELPNQIGQMDDAVLGKVVIDEGGLSDSNIAARRIGSVTIKAGAYDNGGVLFGLSADSIDKLKVLDIPLSLTRLGAAQTLTEENFRVLVL